MSSKNYESITYDMLFIKLIAINKLYLPQFHKKTADRQIRMRCRERGRSIKINAVFWTIKKPLKINRKSN